MRVFDFFEKMHVFNRLVTDEKTGSPDEFAQRLGISRTSLYEVIDELKSRHVVVTYSRAKKSFCYSTPVSLEVKFTINHLEELSDKELRKVIGGSKISQKSFIEIRSVLFGGRKESIFVFGSRI